MKDSCEGISREQTAEAVWDYPYQSNENYTIFGSQTDVNAEIHITKEG